MIEWTKQNLQKIVRGVEKKKYLFSLLQGIEVATWRAMGMDRGETASAVLYPSLEIESAGGGQVLVRLWRVERSMIVF